MAVNLKREGLRAVDPLLHPAYVLFPCASPASPLPHSARAHTQNRAPPASPSRARSFVEKAFATALSSADREVVLSLMAQLGPQELIQSTDHNASEKRTSPRRRGGSGRRGLAAPRPR